MRVYESFGGSFPPSPPYWGKNYIMWDPSDSEGMQINRRHLRLADFDGDGVCDIWWISPVDGKVLRVWLNKIKTTGNFNWQELGDPAPGVTCTESDGISVFDWPVRVADIT